MILPVFHETWFEAAAGIAWPQEFGVITAWNTDGENETTAANAAHDLQLAQRLDELHMQRVRVTGVSPDGTHREEGWACWPCTEALAAELGREFNQLAVYFVENDHLRVISCSSGERAEVAVWSGRLK